MKLLSIAGIDFRFAELDRRADELLDDYAKEFAIEEEGRTGTPELRVFLRTVDEPVRPERGGLEPTITRREHDVLFERYDIDCTWRPDTGVVEASCWGTRTSIGSFLRVLCGLVLPRRGALLVHASSVVSCGRAFLFPGPSGAGKTTLASLGGARPVLCDEISAVRPWRDGADGSDGRNGYLGMPTPFFGEMPRRPRTDPAPLLMIGRPTKNASPDAPPRLIPIGGAVALAEILHCAVAFDESREGRREVVDAASALALCIPAYDVHFSLERDPWGLLDELALSAPK